MSIQISIQNRLTRIKSRKTNRILRHSCRQASGEYMRGRLVELSLLICPSQVIGWLAGWLTGWLAPGVRPLRRLRRMGAEGRGQGR